MPTGLLSLTLLVLGPTCGRNRSSPVASPGPPRVHSGLVYLQAMPLVVDLGGRNRIGFVGGLYYRFTIFGRLLGGLLIGGAMDLFGDQRVLGGDAALSAGSVLLRRGQTAATGRARGAHPPGGRSAHRRARHRLRLNLDVTATGNQYSCAGAAGCFSP